MQIKPKQIESLKSQYIKLTSDSRLYGLDIPVIGLTGGIATGKSTVSGLFEKSGAAVVCADNLIHTIYAKQETLDFIASKSPKVIEAGKINFKILREEFFSIESLKTDIEQYLYAHLPHAFKAAVAKNENPKFIIYDVPLLFEKSLQDKLDLSILVYASAQTQIERLIKRDFITIELAKSILKQQIPIDDKQELSDQIIENIATIEELNIRFQYVTAFLFNKHI